MLLLNEDAEATLLADDASDADDNVGVAAADVGIVEFCLLISIRNLSISIEVLVSLFLVIVKFTVSFFLPNNTKTTLTLSVLPKSSTACSIN